MLAFFQYDFMVRALIAGSIVSIIAPIIGMFLVTRRYAYLADTLAHVSFVGVALGLLFNVNPVVAGVVVAVAAALGMEKLRERRVIGSESAVAIFLSGSLAVAIVIMSLRRGLNVNILHVLFGSITTVTRADVMIIASLGLAAIGLIWLLYKEFFLLSFGEEMAVAEGLPVKRLNMILMILSSVTVALSIRTIGVLLIGALLVIPVVTAFQCGKSFFVTLWIAVGLSFVATIVGLLLSYQFNVPSGGAIVLISLVFFIASLVRRR